MLACYGQSEYHSMTETRQKLWTSKVGRSLASPLKLAPCLNEAFGENVVSQPASSYLEACSGTRPTITTANWEQDCLMPTAVPEGTLLAPVHTAAQINQMFL